MHLAFTMTIFKTILILLCIAINVNSAVIGKMGTGKAPSRAQKKREFKEMMHAESKLNSRFDTEMDPMFRPKNNLEHFREAKKDYRKENMNPRHINKVPRPPYPIFGEPPSGLFGDQKQSTSQDIDDSLHAQRNAFIAMLNYHQRHPKQFKHIDMEERYIILTHDPKTNRYSIVEDSGE